MLLFLPVLLLHVINLIIESIASLDLLLHLCRKRPMLGNPLSPLADCTLLRLLGLRHLLFELSARLKQLTDALFKRLCFLPGTA